MIADADVLDHRGQALDAMAESPGTASADSDRIGYLMVAAAPLAVGLFLWRRWYRLGNAPRRPQVFSASAGAVMFLVMLVLGELGAIAAWYVVLGVPPSRATGALPLHDLAQVQIGRYAAQALAVTAFVWIVRRATAQSPRGRPGAIRAALVGAGALLLFWPIVQCAAVTAGHVVEYVRGEPVEPVAHDTLRLLLDSPVDGWFFVMAALVVLATPVLEEVMYRGILQHTLGRAGMGRWPAIITTSAIFALMHLDVAAWHALAALFVLSIGFGWVYEKTGRLAASVTMHALFNAANLALAPLSVPGVC